MMQHFQDQSDGRQLIRPWHTCLASSQEQEKSEYNRSFSSFAFAAFTWPLRLWRQQTFKQFLLTAPLDQDTRTFLETLQTLIYRSEDAYKISSPNIGVAVPEWLADTQAYGIIQAITQMGASISMLEHAPAAAFTAAGYDLCRVDSEWLLCAPPGRIMALEDTDTALTASLVPTPFFYWMRKKLVYDVNPEFGYAQISVASGDVEHKTQAVAAWIDSFAATNNPDKIMLLGPHTNHAVFKNAIRMTTVSELVVGDEKIPPESTVVQGIAKMAKDALESQLEDCIKKDECVELRRKADALASASRVVDSAASSAHIEL